jgi:CDP-2,3-bis-(O-geranylgeranyl)-sn-glycerol synthase
MAAIVPACFVLLLIGAANTAPLFAKKWFGARLAWPIDGNATWFDGRPLFGHSKTVRGVAFGIAAPALLAWPLGHPMWQGAAIGATAMAGDLISSFCKRRMKLPPSSQAFGLDQGPEVLLPVLIARDWFRLTMFDAALVVVVFFFLEVVLSKLLFHLHLLRDRPY